MARYAVISDIHGHFDALQAVWTEIEAEKLDYSIIFNAGDMVVYGPHSRECVEFIRAKWNIVTIAGNYDRNVALFAEKQADYRKKWGHQRPHKMEALGIASETIGEGNRAWLASLPTEITRSLDSFTIHMSHFAPCSKYEGLFPHTPDERLEEIAAKVNADVIIVGHTHAPFVRSAGGALFLNPGSVGQSYFKSGAPAWAILDLTPGQPPSAELRRCRL